VNLRVSVVIPAYRAAHTIRRAVDSVLAQSQPADEIIIVDDGSPDDIAGAVRPYGDQVKYLQKPNGGAGSARNAGIDVATGDLVAFLDADDYWEPDKLRRQLAVFRTHPEVGLIAGVWFIEIPSRQRTTGNSLKAKWCNRVLTCRGAEAFQIAMLIWTGTVLIRRHLLISERFDSGLETAEDRDLWARLVRKAPAYLMSEPLSTAVLEPQSLSRTNPDRDCGNMMRVVRRNRTQLGFWAYCQWVAFTYYRWSIGGDSVKSALGCILKSLLIWPLPFIALNEDCGRTLPRLQRLAYLTTNLVRERRL
jgi:glycosyltransferase involved in cell wall biosynthesis